MMKTIYVINVFLYSTNGDLTQSQSVFASNSCVAADAKANELAEKYTKTFEATITDVDNKAGTITMETSLGDHILICVDSVDFKEV